MRLGSLVLILIVAAQCAHGAELSSLLRGWKVEFKGLPELEIDSDQGATGAANEVRDISAKGNGKTLRISRISGLDAASARRYTADRKAEIAAVYERRFDGYFPVQAKGVVCPEKLKPKARARKNGSTQVDALLFHASERHVAVCLQSLAKVRALAAFVYCEAKKEMYDIRYFVPARQYSDRDERAILSFSCEKSS